MSNKSDIHMLLDDGTPQIYFNQMNHIHQQLVDFTPAQISKTNATITPEEHHDGHFQWCKYITSTVFWNNYNPYLNTIFAPQGKQGIF